jgi:hypothetical protein
MTKPYLFILPLAALSLTFLTGATVPRSLALRKAMTTAKSVPFEKLTEIFKSNPTYDAICFHTTTGFPGSPGKAIAEASAADPNLDKWDRFTADDDSRIPEFLVPKVNEAATGKMQFKYQAVNNGEFTISILSKIDMGNRELPILSRAEPIELKCLIDENVDCRALVAPMNVMKVPLETLMSPEEIKAGEFKEATVNGQVNIVFPEASPETLILKFGTDIKAVVPGHKQGWAAWIPPKEKAFVGHWICELKKAKN